MDKPQSMKEGKPLVALVANTTWNIYNFRLNVIDRLHSEGWNVAVLAPIDEYLEYKEKYPYVTHINIRTLNRDSKNPLRDILLTLELIRRYKKLKPDLLIHYTNKPNIYGGIAAGISNINSVAVVTGLGYAFIRNGWIRKITTQLYRYSSRFHKKFIFENIDDKNLFEKLNISTPDQSVAVKGCGVDTNYYTPRPKMDNDKLVFTFIGRLLYDKGIREFIQAAEEIKSKYEDVEFWIVGELDDQNPATIDHDDLIKWINNKTVVYHGFQRDVREYIANSDCIVLPSYREGLPRIVMEGMSMSRAIITTDAPGCKETVKPGVTGYLVPVKNPRMLAEAMDKYINLSREEQLDMGVKGREMATQIFDSKKIANEIFDIVSKTLE